MDAKQYIENVLKTESNNFGEINTRLLSTRITRLLHASIGLNTEQAEFADALKKFIFYGRPIDEINLKEEIGDLFWYLAIACKELNVSFEEIWEVNIAKLEKRYGTSFNKENAITRDLEEERKILALRHEARMCDICSADICTRSDCKEHNIHIERFHKQAVCLHSNIDIVDTNICPDCKKIIDPTPYFNPYQKVEHSAMFCDHANEVPAKCPCDSDCFCKTRTCKIKYTLKTDSNRSHFIGCLKQIDISFPCTCDQFKDKEQKTVEIKKEDCLDIAKDLLQSSQTELCNQPCELEKQIGKHFKSDHYAAARGEFK